MGVVCLSWAVHHMCCALVVSDLAVTFAVMLARFPGHQLGVWSVVLFSARVLQMSA